jgi:hypothetical protein
LWFVVFACRGRGGGVLWLVVVALQARSRGRTSKGLTTGLELMLLDAAIIA